MSIIYSYPEQTTLNDNDTLLGTSAALVGGKKKNITRNFSLSELSTYFGVGSIINPVASDFKLAVFNQGGTKITDSIISQNAFPNGSAIIITGSLTATSGTFNGFLDVNGGASLGTGSENEIVTLASTTRFNAPIQDQVGIVGALDQILISDAAGRVSWQNYTSGLTYTGTWDATNNVTAPQGVPLVSSVGTNGEFYIVTVAGNTQLNGQPVTPTTPPYWNIGDWVVFVENGAAGVWQKIDNSSALIGTGTDNKIAMWTGGATPSTTLTDSLISQDAGATVVTVAGALTSTGNINGVNITGTGNLSGDNLLLTGTVSLNTQLGTSGQVLTSQGTADAIWANPTPVNNITGSGTVNTLSMFTNQYTVGDSIVTQDAGGTIVTTAGNSSITGYIQPTTLQDAGASPGTAGQVLTSTGTALDWVGANTIGDTYTISSTTTPGANRVPIDLTAASGAGASSILNLVEGSGITLTQTSSTEITIASTVTSGVNSLQQILGTNSSTTALDLTGTASGGVLIGNITIALNEFGGSGFIGTVPSAGAGTDNQKFLRGNGNWETPTDTDTTYTLAAGVKSAASVPLNLTPSTGSGTAVNLTEGTGITLTRNAAGNDITIAGSAQGVTSVSGTANRIAITGTPTAPIVNAVTGTVNSSSLTLATGQEIQSAINAALIGFLEFKGGFNAASGVIDGGTDNLTVGAARVAVEIGDFYIVTTAGDFYGDATEPLAIGDQVIAITAYLVGQSAIAGWVKVQQNIGVATDVVQGIANFPTGNNQLNIATGSVTAKTFGDGNSGTSTTGGYVPDATSAAAGTFLKKDGTWSVAGSLTGTGTQYKVPLWSNVAGTALGNSLFTQDPSATKVTLDGLLEVLGDGTLTGTGGQIKLNCSFGTHGITIESAPHSDNATYTLILPSTLTNTTGKVLTSGGSSAGAQLTWSTPVTSVGLTETGNALTITNSPITSTGNINIAGAGASTQYINGELNLVTFPTVDNYVSWTADSDQGTNIAVTSGVNLKFTGAVTASGAGIATDSAVSANEMTIGLINAGGTPSATTFYRGDGQWAAPTASGASVIDVFSTPTVSLTGAVFGPMTGVAPPNTSYTEVYFDGVYQEIGNYSITGTNNITFYTTPPTGVSIEVRVVSDVTLANVLTSINGNTGPDVILNLTTYITGNLSPTDVNQKAFVFTSATAYTLTLPANPSVGDSFKIAQRYNGTDPAVVGPTTNTIARPAGQLIMGLDQDLVIDNVAASFEMICTTANATTNQGWVIIGAGA